MRDYEFQEWTIGRVLADKAERIPQRTFLIWQGRRFCYAELERMTSRYANGLTAQGIGPGDHVAVMMTNCPEFLWLVWGLGKIGAVAVLVNTAARGEMLRYFVDQSDASCVVVGGEWAARVVEVSPQLPKVRGYFVGGDLSAGAFAAGAPDARILPLALLESTDESRPPLERVSPDDTQFIIYTSGTTGPSKGVMCPHSQAHAVGREVTRHFDYRPDDVLYTCLPLFHANAMWFSCYAALWADAAVALSERFSATRFWEDVRTSGATQFNSLGAMTSILLKLPPGPHERDHKLRLCMAVPMHEEVYRQLRERFGVTVTSVFGMSEISVPTLFLPDDRSDKAGSAGRTHGIWDLRIVDDDDRDLPPGQVGELWLRPRQPGIMMKGYYKMPSETARALAEGWLHTGDRCWVDTDGYMYYVDRKKEAIRRRGENISAYEVEMILCKHPAISEVAAVSVASELSEDEVMVYVVRKPGADLAHADVVSFAAEHMSYFMVPRFVEFIDRLPKTTTEKIEKYKLKKDAESRRDELWDREREGVRIAR